MIYGGFELNLIIDGDLYIDDYYSVEDIVFVFGEVFKKVLGDKCGIGCFGFVLLMDECCVECIMDILNCLYFKFDVEFSCD